MRPGLLLFFSMLLGCSGPGNRPDAEHTQGPPVVTGATLEDDSIPALTATDANGASEQPAVLFRCEEGQLRAYMVPGGAGEGALLEEQMVSISLDSAPGC